MADDPTEMPPANLILQALHAIRTEVRDGFVRTNEQLGQTNSRIDQTNARLEQTNERLENLRFFTVNKLTELNTKLDGTNERIDRLTDRFDNFISGEGAKLVKRVDALEGQVQQLLARQPH